MNELLWALMLVLNFSAIMLSFRLWGKIGLFIWIPISVIIANIQVTKKIQMFSVETTLDNIFNATSFLAADILNECYRRKEAARAVGIGFFALIVMTVLMNVAIIFIPAESDIVQDSLKTIFSLMPRIAAASLVAYLASQAHDIWAFEFWKKIRPSRKWLWLRNNASTMVSQLIDTLLFTLIAFYGIFQWSVLWQIMLSTYVLKWVVAVLDTPFMYLATKWHIEKKDGFLQQS